MESCPTNQKSHQEDTTYAKKYSEYDAFVCVPVSIDKRPIVSWKYIASTPKNIFKDCHNIAMMTGKINGITVVDIDNLKFDNDDINGLKKYEELLKKINNDVDLKVPTCTTQSKGLHLYFKYDQDIKNTSHLNGYSIDIKNDNALIIIPPSVGTKGSYDWKDNMSLHNTELRDMPKWLKDWLMMSINKKKIETISIESENDDYPSSEKQ
jgi:hypothetical protein